jgi:UDP:flavonoid glycosyltransferase YjiC (YdhE family)
MHFVFNASGSLGDLAPLICLAVELRRRGHECVFVVNGHHEAMLVKCGFAVEITGQASEYAKAMNDPALNHPRKFIEVLAGAAANELRDVYGAILRVARPDSVLVYRVTAMAARVAAEKLGLRDCAVGLMPYEICGYENPPALGSPLVNRVVRALPESMRKNGVARLEKQFAGPVLIPALEALRKEAGLAPMAGLMRAEVRKCAEILLTYPEWYGGRESYWPAQMRHAGFLFLPQMREADEVVDGFLDAGPPPVLVTMGSAVRVKDGLTERLVRLSRELGRRVLCADFTHEGQPRVEGDVCVSAPLWLDPVLPKCVALVHRGGVGVMAMALRFGVPQLIIGQVMDHPDNGERVTRLGAGRWCYTAWTTDRALKKALAAVIEDPVLREGARACAARIAEDRSLEVACDRIEALGSR